MADFAFNPSNIVTHMVTTGLKCAPEIGPTFVEKQLLRIPNTDFSHYYQQKSSPSKQMLVQLLPLLTLLLPNKEKTCQPIPKRKSEKKN